MLITAAWIVGGIIWLVGSATTLHDLLDHGKSLKDYREQYGKDLGMLICCTYRGGMIAAWPVMGLGGFGIGIIRDTLRLFKGDKNSKTEDEANGYIEGQSEAGA